MSSLHVRVAAPCKRTETSGKRALLIRSPSALRRSRPFALRASQSTWNHATRLYENRAGTHLRSACRGYADKLRCCLKRLFESTIPCRGCRHVGAPACNRQGCARKVRTLRRAGQVSSWRLALPRGRPEPSRRQRDTAVTRAATTSPTGHLPDCRSIRRESPPIRTGLHTAA